MTEQQLLWFNKLRAGKQQDWLTFSKPEYRGFFESLVNKYNDSAHFLYELLQNADDAGATDVDIRLEKERIIFTHNGYERFTISAPDPQTTKSDRANGTLGHLNSITAINFSSKVQLAHNKIGKFGIGFKAVYQYTTAPYIYDDGICFKIENFIIPTLLGDTSHVVKGKTVFILPFDQEETKDRAYDEISRKLLGLNHPQLYLHNIKNIRWKTETNEGQISQRLLKGYDFKGLDIHTERLALTGGKGQKETEILNIWRTVNITGKGSFPIAISYYLDGKQHIDTSKKRKLNCYFPTNESIGTCYAIHAPFLLTESRQSLLGGEPVNCELFKAIAQLVADSLIVLRDISTKEQSFLLGDDIKKLTEVSLSDLSNWDALIEEGLFKKEYDTKFRNEALFLSSQSNYLKAEESYWADKEIQDLLSSEQLLKLTGKREFVLCSCTNYPSDVKGFGIDELNSKGLALKIFSDFLSEQSTEWLDKFYSFVNENEANAKAKSKDGNFHYCPIFKTDANTFVAAFERNNEKPILCLYTEGITMPNATINQEMLQQSDGFKSLIETCGIKTAEYFDYIKARLREKQDGWSQEEANAFWKVLIAYWTDCNDEEKRELHNELSNRLWVKCNIAGTDNSGFANISSVYLPSDEIEVYYKRAANAYWWYLKTTSYSDSVVRQKQNEVLNQLLFDEDYYQTVKDKDVEKFNAFIKWLEISKYPKLLTFKFAGKDYTNIDNLFRVTHFIWAVDIDKNNLGNEVKDLSHYVWEILNHYDISHYVIGEYNDLKAYNYDKCGSLIDLLRNEKWLVIDNERVCPKDTCQEDVYRNGYEGTDLMNILGIEKRKGYAEEALLQVLPNELKSRLSSEEWINVFKVLTNFTTVNTKNDDDESDEAIEDKSIRTFEEISTEQLVEQTERYTYKWFKLLIDLEAEACGEPDDEKKRRALKVCFASVVFPVEKDIVRLECASRYVPTSVEEIDDLEIAFCMTDGSQTKIKFDAVSVKDSVLSLKIKQQQKAEIEKLRQCSSKISHAEINCEQPIELLQSWRRIIREMQFSDSYSLKENLRRDDIRFIFGPPGTGKTYRLAQFIINKMRMENVQRILVLTPTNKACDVITKKIMDLAPYDCPWLSRFAKTLSDRIENEGIVLFRDSPLKEQACLVTTIARYAYDSCSEGLLRETDWDIVVIDEASMIPLYQIIAPLYNDKLHELTIAGDPFQIQPIVVKPQWKDENIYTMLELRNFANPTTNPEGFKVDTLTHQWRSIPEIGELYSRYSYNGLLTHNRKSEERMLLNMGFDAHPLNIVTFPVSKESTFATQKLKGSSIQVYSVIFTVELLKFVTQNIAKNNGDKEVSIGVVCPYKAEVQAISKMYEQLGEHYNNISISFGTAHGFQGDECNVMFAIMNPPASGLIKAAQGTHINNQNIINVSISRATDYLFIVMPNSGYEHSDKLIELNRLQSVLWDLDCKYFTHDDIERLIYGRKGVIEENTFVTSHQMTNVYSDFSKKYEVRIDETSMDIQVNEQK